MSEIRERFVDQAPAGTRLRRSMIQDAVELHVKLCRRLFKDFEIEIWINGGYTTHKDWSPRDADIAYVVPAEAIPLATREVAIPLWTLADVTARTGDAREVVTPKLHTMGGLLDTYVLDASNPPLNELTKRLWTAVRRRDGSIEEGMTKGFVEVIADE